MATIDSNGAPFKDPEQLCFQDWEKVNVEMLNGLLATNYYASNIVTDSIPKYLRKTNGEFPTVVNFGKTLYGLFSRVVFRGNCGINAGRISLDAGKSLELTIYPNVEPMVSWDEFIIETNSECNLSFKMTRQDKSIAYPEKTFNSSNKKIKITLGTGISNKVEDMIITITNKGSANVLITDIDYTFTLKSRLNNLLSDINAGFLKGLTVEQLMELFLSKITKPFLEAIIEPPAPAINPYPIGSIYISTSNTNPSSVIGGTWVQLKDRFLLCAGDTYKAGATGGAATHTLSANEMPSHSHNVSVASGGGGTTSSNAHFHYVRYCWDAVTTAEGAGKSRVFFQGPNNSDTLVQSNTHSHTTPNHSHSVSQSGAGGGASHNNMPPYIVVYVWQRTG